MAWRERQKENEMSQRGKAGMTKKCSFGSEQCAAVVCHETPPSPDQHKPMNVMESTILHQY